MSYFARLLAGAATFAAVVAGCHTSDVGDEAAFTTGTTNGYGSTGVSCGPYPRVAVGTADGTCLGLVAASGDAQFKPRVILELPGRQGEMLISDLNKGWAPGKGRLWYLDARDPAAVTLKPILGGLTVPHQLLIGPGGRVYFSEDSRISAFPLSAVSADGELDASQIEVVLDGLPPMDVGDTRISMHPISHFVFDGDGNMFVNIGAYTDHCTNFVGQECLETDQRISDGTSSDPKDWGAVIRRYDRIGDDEFSTDFEIVALGLRNSMGLLFTPSGDLLQVENGRDFEDGGRPFEEINVIPKAELYGQAPPMHYGWPYCYDAYETSDEWVGYDGFRCAPDNPDYRPPHLLLPPHGAPLGLARYEADLFEELKGQLIVPLHGYRAPGHRVLAFEVGDDGLPLRTESAFFLEDPTQGSASTEKAYPVSDHGQFAGQATHLVDAWFAVEGFRPKGGPVAPMVASDGSIWIADDKNAAILRFDRAEGKLPPLQKENLYPAYRRYLDDNPEVRALYDAIVAEVLESEQCSGCHDNFRLAGDESRYPELRYLLTLGSWITPGDPEGSALYSKLSPAGSAAMPPIDRPWESVAQGEAALATIAAFIEALPVLEPGLNDGWIGGQCTPGFDSDCPYDGGYCTEGGSCSLGCTKAQPYCPDRDGMAGTFCVDLGGDVGGCVVTCDPAAPQCLPGQSCEPETRYGQTSPTKYVCVGG